MMFLFFAGPPGPVGNLKVTDSTQSSISLGWSKPTDDGGAPIIGYVVETRVRGAKKDEGWRRCNVAAQLIVTEFTVSSLDARLQYEFRVSCQNQIGLGPATNLEGAVVPKEILGTFF